MSREVYWGFRPRNFEPQSNDEDDTSADTPFSKLLHHATGDFVRLQINVHSPSKWQIFNDTRTRINATPVSSECIFTSPCSATRRFLVVDLAILNQVQVTRRIPDLTPSFSPNYHTTPTGGRLSPRQI
ncbi:hypothetical protein TNCV_1907701 [Trichonephila clavipes]|nr:hypothetical protein TNCV_1907701 [Trichonephila clavipes]